MGFWSTSLYGNDLTLDVRDKLDDLLKSGVSPQDVYQEMLNVLKKYSQLMKNLYFGLL